MSDRIDALIALHNTLIDSRNGYQEARRKSQGEGLDPLFNDLVSLHQSAASEIAHSLARLGVKGDNDGSFMSTVHKLVIDARAAITGLDYSVLPSLISGEHRVMDSYDAAISVHQPGDPAYDILLTQRSALARMIDRMKILAAEHGVTV